MKIRKKLNAIEKYEEEHQILLKTSSCHYLIPYHEAFLWDFQGDWGMKWCIVYSYYENGNLYAYIVSAKENKTLTGKGVKEDERQIIDWIIQLSEGLTVLHNLDIIHRNVKSSKIFLDSYNGVKLGDMGLTKDLEDEEIKNLTKENNVLSLAIVLLELLTLHAGVTEQGWENYIPFIPKEYSNNWSNVLKNVFEGKSLFTLVQALREMRKSLVSPVQESEIAIDSLMNMKRMISGHRSQETEDKFVCDYPGCKKGYGKKYTLNRHKKTHLAFSAYVCRWCSKHFVDNSSLVRHER